MTCPHCGKTFDAPDYGEVSARITEGEREKAAEFERRNVAVRTEHAEQRKFSHGGIGPYVAPVPGEPEAAQHYTGDQQHFTVDQISNETASISNTEEPKPEVLEPAESRGVPGV